MGYKVDSNILKAESELKDKLSSFGIEIILNDDKEDNDEEKEN